MLKNYLRNSATKKDDIDRNKNKKFKRKTRKVSRRIIM